MIEIDAASHGGVDDARDLRERAFYAPVSGRYKIYIIDEAHMVTREGFNALLKLVEEPPPHLKFVFATTEPEKVIADDPVAHPPLPVPAGAARHPARTAGGDPQRESRSATSPRCCRWWSAPGAGSARDSLSVLDQLLAGAGEEGLPTSGRWPCSATPTRTSWTRSRTRSPTEDGAAVFRAVDRVMEGGHDPRRFAADLLDRLRDLIVLAAVPGAGQTGLLDMPAGPAGPDVGAGGPVRPGRADPGGGDHQRGLIQMRGATSPRLLLELMCAQILLPGAASGEKASLVRLERLERRLEGAPVTPVGQPGCLRPGARCPPFRPLRRGSHFHPGSLHRAPAAPASAAPAGSARASRVRRADGARTPRPGRGPPAAAKAEPQAAQRADGPAPSRPRPPASSLSPASAPAPAPAPAGSSAPSPASPGRSARSGRRHAGVPLTRARGGCPRAARRPTPPAGRPRRSITSGSAGRRSSKRSRASAGWPGCCSATPPCTRSRAAC